MTDRDERTLSAEEEARVAALLSEAATPVAVPPEVADRLDGVLAELVGERATAAPKPPGAATAEVTPLRRRRRPVLLLAAAAVVAGGFAVPSLLDDEAPVTRSTAVDEAREGGATDGATRDSAGAAESAPPAGPGGASEGVERAPAGALRTTPDQEVRLVPALGPVPLTPDRLEQDVLGALRAGQRLDVVPQPDASVARPVCPAPELAAGESWSPAEYAGQPAVLVAGPEQDGSVEALVRSCDGELLDEATVEVR